MRENGSFASCNSCKRLSPSRLHSHMRQNFNLFQVSNFTVLNFRFFLLMYPGSPAGGSQLSSRPTADCSADPSPGHPSSLQPADRAVSRHFHLAALWRAASGRAERYAVFLLASSRDESNGNLPRLRGFGRQFESCRPASVCATRK